MSLWPTTLLFVTALELTHTHRSALDLMAFDHLVSLFQVKEKYQAFLVVRTL